jgi:HEPN domain-containing protein
MSNEDNPDAWIAKAQGDLLCIENNLVARDIPWEVVAFHAQQAAEKALKGFLVSRKQTVVKTHDVTFLLNQCRALGARLDGLDEDCRWLTRYATQFRYPDESDLGKDEALKAVDAAKRVFNAVASALSSVQ